MAVHPQEKSLGAYCGEGRLAQVLEEQMSTWVLESVPEIGPVCAQPRVVVEAASGCRESV